MTDPNVIVNTERELTGREANNKVFNAISKSGEYTNIKQLRGSTISAVNQNGQTCYFLTTHNYRSDRFGGKIYQAQNLNQNTPNSKFVFVLDHVNEDELERARSQASEITDDVYTMDQFCNSLQ